jgi:hypothetical protein
MRPATPLADILEKDWQTQVIDLARLLGWRVAHFRPAKTSKGWRTAVAADGEGYPDLTLTRDRVIFLELKRETGKTTQAQRDWLTALHTAGAETYVARPRHLQALAVVLGPGKGPSYHEGRGELLLELDQHLTTKGAAA